MWRLQSNRDGKESFGVISEGLEFRSFEADGVNLLLTPAHLPSCRLRRVIARLPRDIFADNPTRPLPALRAKHCLHSVPGCWLLSARGMVGWRSNEDTPASLDSLRRVQKEVVKKWRAKAVYFSRLVWHYLVLKN